MPADVGSVRFLDPRTNHLVESSTRVSFCVTALFDMTIIEGDPNRTIHISSGCEHDHHICVRWRRLFPRS